MEYSSSYTLRKELDIIAKDVIEKLPHPFGSFEKAKYILLNTMGIGRTNTESYSFVTTTRNTEWCVEYLKKKFDELPVRTGNHFAIVKVVDGEAIVLFASEGGNGMTRKSLVAKVEKIKNGYGEQKG